MQKRNSMKAMAKIGGQYFQKSGSLLSDSTLYRTRPTGCSFIITLVP